MSKIDGIIPEQGFETVRDLIGAILKIELESQKTKQNLTDEIHIYTSRSTPFHQSEQLMINVLLDSGDYSNITEKGSHERTVFFIDVYTSSKETEDSDGGYNSTRKCDKYLGMIRYILSDHHYKTLGLPPGLIMGTYVDSFENFEPSNTQDAAYIKMSRLSFSVRINEDQSLWEGIKINSIFTQVKLDLTNKGYKYESNY